MDFITRFGGVVCSVTTVFAVICIVLQSAIDAYHGTGPGKPTGRPLSATAVISFVGTFFFSAVNPYINPTIQHDMEQPERFTLTSATANTGKELQV